MSGAGKRRVDMCCEIVSILRLPASVIHLSIAPTAFFDVKNFLAVMLSSPVL
jgi:hypothetical protein